MSGPVITISRQLGSQGDALGLQLAQRLNIPLLAQEVLEVAAEEAGVSLETLESAERVPSWIERVLDSIGRTSGFEMEMATDPLTPTTLDLMMTSADYRRLILNVVEGLASRGPCVIIGHAAQIALRDRSDVLRVYLHAPAGIRAQRVAQERGVSVSEATRLVREDDQQRNALFRSYYDVRWDNPELYVLTLNTGVLDLDTATDVVLQVAQRMASAP